MIPKVIHYCWFSKEPIPFSLKVCMKSWKKIMPDYEIRWWTLDDIDINKVDWLKEAYEVKAWAFITDYVRLYLLYNNGGIYLDTDVLVKKRFDDYLSNSFFSSIEYHPEMVEAGTQATTRLDSEGRNLYPGVRVPGLGIQAAIMGAEKGHPYIKKCMEYYETNHFIRDDGTWNIELIAPDIFAIIAESFGLCYTKDKEQTLSEGMKIYSYKIFPGSYAQTTRQAVAVHLSKGGWRERNWIRSILTILKFYKKIVGAQSV